MNENGLPICDLTEINHFDKTLNGNQENSCLSSQSISTVEIKENVIGNTSMSNGGILYAPIPVPHQNTFPGNDILRQIIAHDVHHPNSIKTSNANSRNMVIKTAPHGAVQITYRKMIHSLPEYKKPIHILPKPNPKHVNFIPFDPFNTKTVQDTKLLDNYCIASNISTFPSHVFSRTMQPTINNACPPLSSTAYSNPKRSINNPAAKPVEGSSKNLFISLPKIKKSSALTALQLSNETSLINSDKSLYTPFSENNFEVSHVPSFESTYEMDDVNEFMTSSQNSNLSNGDLGQINEMDMNLLSMDIDSLDAITMTTFLQNGTIFNADFNDNIAVPNNVMNLKQSSDMNSLMATSNVVQEFTPVDTINSSVVAMTNQNIDPIVTSADDVECNSSAYINLKIAKDYQKKIDLSCSNVNGDPNRLMSIIDVSPDMSSTLGGCKIILIGSWNAKDSRYSCKFGDQIVNAELIQNGVLRCYSPKHKPGKIKLCVICDNGIGSNEVDFLIFNPSDISNHSTTKHKEWISITNKSLIVMLIERVAAIAEIIGVDSFSKHLSEIKSNAVEGLKQYQEHLVIICKRLMTETVNFTFDYDVENTMTMLHLAAALGFTKLIQLLLKWVETNPNKLIMVEACPTQYDQFSLLPIMWSSAKGHFNTTCVLHQWEESTIKEFDACGCTAIDLAKESGHETITEYLQRLQKKSVASKETTVQPEGFHQPSLVGTLEPQQQLTNLGILPTYDGCSSRTLGKTLARIQSMISGQDDEANLDDLNLDGEESLFETSPFTLRQRTVPEKNIVSLNVQNQNSPVPASIPSQSPFNRQTFQTAEFCEFFYKAKKIEKDFAELTLTDEEQQDLLRAANVIQSAYKTYKERRKRRDQEFCAAVLIQSYYRRYKQYAAFKKMQKGAVVIQNQYRAHREKSKKKIKAARTIQAYYRRYREKKNDVHEDVQMKNKMQQQADRKINRYLKQTSSRFSKEFPDSFVNDGNCSTSLEQN